MSVKDEMIKLKEIKYEGKTIKDDFHRIILFDKNYKLIKYDAIVKYAENYVSDEKEIIVHHADGSLDDKVLHIAIDKVCDDAADLETQCRITFGEDQYFPNQNMEMKDFPKEKELDDLVYREQPTIHFDKKVLESGLTFKEAYMRMVEGKKISRPSFIGFWYIDSFDGKMKIHDRFGNTLEKVDMTITVINTLANDWEVIE